MLTISEKKLTDALARPALVEALRQGFKEGVSVPDRHHHTVPRSTEDATLLLMPAWRKDGPIGFKMVTVFPSNSAQNLPSIYGTYTLLDGDTGIPLAQMDGRILTLFRTAATSVLAATYLAPKSAKRLLMVGTGALAPHIIATYVEVLGIEEVRLWGRNDQKAQSMAADLSGAGYPVEATGSIEEAAPWADVISCATLSPTPLLQGAWLSPGTFVDLIGSYTPTMREADNEVIRRGAVFVDTRPGALTEAGDIMLPIQDGVMTPDDIQADLFELTRDEHPGRQSADEITVFKSSGYALEDLIAAEMVYEAVRQHS